MAEISPMFNGRFNRLPCNCCCGDGMRGRAAEKRSWQAEVEAEVAEVMGRLQQELDDPSYSLDHDWKKVTCERCGHHGGYPFEVTFSDEGEALCRVGCLEIVEVLHESFWTEIDLSDPVMSVR